MTVVILVIYISGGHILSEWKTDSTHLVMDKLTFTIKVRFPSKIFSIEAL